MTMPTISACKMFWLVNTVLLCGTQLVKSEVYFQETFDNETWESRWVPTKALMYGFPSAYFHLSDEKGLRITTNNRMHLYSARFEKPFSNLDKTLVLQYDLKDTVERKNNCSLVSIKLYNCSRNQNTLQVYSKYLIEFGPNDCVSEQGSVKRNIEVGFGNHQVLAFKRPALTKEDSLTHTYTLVVHPNGTFNVKLDHKVFAVGDASTIYWQREQYCIVALQVFQMNAGLVIDNILLTDDEEYAEKFPSNGATVTISTSFSIVMITLLLNVLAQHRSDTQ